MDLKIKEIKNEGGADKERVLIRVLRDCDTESYILFDTTYTDEGEISNELRHAFFFPSVQVEKGDLVRVHTKEGKYKRWVSSSEVVYHDFFWGLDEPIWNDEGDCALLIEVTDKSSKCVGE